MNESAPKKFTPVPFPADLVEHTHGWAGESPFAGMRGSGNGAAHSSLEFNLDNLPDLIVVEFEGESIATSRDEIMAMLNWLIAAYQKGEFWKD